jgi:iron complex outermembrane receptor protein
MVRVKLPQYGGPGIVNEAYANGGDGSSAVALRGLPTSATLLLVNGRRTSTSDLNLIPEAAIERIDILNDGAGAIYGSDAVAGVVNIILKDTFSGSKFDARYGNTFDTDVSERKFSALFGTATETAKFLVSAEYSAANSQFSVDRARSRPLPNAVSGTSNPGSFTPAGLPSNFIPLRWSLVPGNTFGLTSASQIPAGFNPVVAVDRTGLTSAQATAARNAQEAALNATLPADSPVRYGPTPSISPGINPGFPFGFYTIAYRPHEKYSSYASAEQSLFGENLTAFIDGYYARNQSQNQLAPSPLAGRNLPTGNYWYNSIFGSSATNDLTFSYRPVEIGPRVVYTDFESFHGIAGLKGRIAESSWNWELGFMWDRVSIDETQTGGVDAGIYDGLLATTDSSAFNPFGYTPIGGQSSVNSAATLASFAAQGTTRQIVSTMQGDFHVHGNVFELPGGPLGVALGAESRHEKLDYAPDFAIKNGLIFPFNVVQPLVASRSVNSGYGEILIPIFNEAMDIPAFSALEISVAARYEDYSDVGNTGVKPRISFRWQPMGKQLTIRGSYAQGYSAPGFFDLYQLPGQDFIELQNPTDPPGQKFQPTEAVLTVGNPNLKPSEAESYLIGFVWSPDALKGFKVGANYYRIDQSKIPFQSAQYIVNQWFAAGGEDNASNPYGPTAGPSAQNPLGAQVELNSDGSLFQVRNVGPINSGNRNTDGIDLIISQELNTDIGKFTLSGQATRVLTFKQENFPGAGTVDYLGKFWASGAALEEVGFPEWRANITLSWEWERFNAAIAWNYTDGYTEDASGLNFDGAPGDLAPTGVPSYQTVDLRVGYKIPKLEANLMFGINNLFDEAPPLVTSTFGDGYDRSIGDIRGRMYFVSLSKTF